MKLNVTNILTSICILLLCIGFFFLIEAKSTKSQEKLVDSLTNLIKCKMEQAYAEGQFDAIRGKVIVKVLNDSTCVWTTSPWKSGIKTGSDTVIIRK